MAFNPNTFSYSSLKKYETCPRQYAEIVVRRNYADSYTSTKGDYGGRLHKAVDDVLSGTAELPEEFSFLETILQALCAASGKRISECKMGVRADGTPAKWNDNTRWFQGIADLLIVSDGPTARIIDWKTGDAKYADTDQLELMALLTFAHYPHIKYVKGMLVFVLSGQVRQRNVRIEERDGIWQKYKERDAKRVASVYADNYPAKESGLCRKHCVVVSCEHNGKK